MSEQDPDILKAYAEIVKSGGGAIQYYSKVDVFILNGNPVFCDDKEYRKKILDYKIARLELLDLINMRFEVRLNGGWVLQFSKSYFNGVNDSNRKMWRWASIGIVHKGEFIEMPTVVYYEMNNSMHMFYTEDFDLINEMPILCRIIFIKPIISYSKFDTFAVVNYHIVNYSNVIREGNYIYINDVKHAIAHDDGYVKIHNTKTGKKNNPYK